MLYTAVVPPVLMLLVVCLCFSKRRKTHFVVNALSGIIKEETINNEKVLIFGGRKLPELDYKMVKNSRTFKPSGGFLGFLIMSCWVAILRLCCCRTRFDRRYLSLGGALLLFSVIFVSALVQIFVVVASLEVTFKCRYDLFLDCFKPISSLDSSPVNCTTSVQDRIFICYRLVVFYPHNWLLACVKTFMFAKMMHLVFNFFARVMLFLANTCCCSTSISIRIFFFASVVAAGFYVYYVYQKMTQSEDYRFSTITNWRMAAGTILVFIFIGLIPWKDIGNEKMEALDVASKASEEQ